MEATMKGFEDANNEKATIPDNVGASSGKRRRPLFRRKWTSVDRRSAGALLAMHLLCLLAPFYFNWEAFWVAFALYIITGIFGLTLSYHRHLTHKSFKLPKWLEYIFAYLGVQTLQGDPIDWVSTHRYHHQFVETERDPHTPTEGFLFGHIAWLFDSIYLTQKVTPKNLIDFDKKNAKPKFFSNMFVAYMKYGRPNNVEDLQSQAFYRFLRKTYLLHIIALGIVLYAIGGFPFVVWGMGVRIVWLQHLTFFVNSICHMWGSQPWNTGDQSRNNWVLGLLMFGEGWHNNHHAFEYSARHGLEWWQLDVTWWAILFLEAIGLATDVKYPSQLQKQKMAKKPNKHEN